MTKKTDYQLQIIAAIRKIREEHGYSQIKIANLLGITYGQMGNIESSKMPTKYTLSQIAKICEHFNVPIECIFLEECKNKDIIKSLINKIILYYGR